MSKETLNPEILDSKNPNEEMKSHEKKILGALKEIAPDGNYSEEVIRKAVEKIESEKVTFRVAEYRLETSLDEVISDDEFHNRRSEDFKPNRHWHSITVASEEDKNKWVDLKNEWLYCAWTPNQSTEEQEKNVEIMRELEDRMRELENKE